MKSYFALTAAASQRNGFVLRRAAAGVQRGQGGERLMEGWWRAGLAATGGAGPRKPSLAFLLPLLADHFMKAIAHGVGEGEEFAITIKLNGFARGIHHHLTMAAFVQMRPQFAFEVFGHVAIKKI